MRGYLVNGAREFPDVGRAHVKIGGVCGYGDGELKPENATSVEVQIRQLHPMAHIPI